MAYFCPWLVHTNSVICRYWSRASSVVDTVFGIVKKKDPLFATAKQLCCKWMVRFIGFINVKRDTRWFFKPMWLLSKRCAWQLPKRLWKKRRPNLTCTQTCNQEEEIELLREIYLKVSYILAFTLHSLLSIIVQIRTKNNCFDICRRDLYDVKVNQIKSGWLKTTLDKLKENQVFTECLDKIVDLD